MTQRLVKQLGVALALIGLAAPLAAGWTKSQAVTAATVDWAVGNPFPEPIDADTGLPAYVPFDAALQAMTGSTASTKVLTNANGNEVAAQITTAQQTQSGAIWSTDALSLNQSFSTKMHIYFGNYANNDAGDGMAFAMTGTKPTKLYNAGAGLGVWKVKTSRSTTVDGLPNSFALTIDNYYNSDASDFWVRNAAGKPAPSSQYVGWGFPGASEQYQLYTSADWIAAGNTGFRDLKNLGIKWATGTPADGNASKIGTGTVGLGGYQVLTSDQSFTDGAWHTVAVSWASDGTGGGTLSFAVELTPGGTAVTKSLTWDAATVKKIFGGTSVYWGFTGSTGANVENAVVTFETIPGLVNASVTTGLTAQDGTAAPATVYQGAQLKQTYTLNYDGTQSKQDWPVQNQTNTAALSARLQTDSHYGFVVGADGKVAVTVVAGSQTRQLTGDPVGTVTTVQDLAGNDVQVVDQVSLTSLPGFLKANGKQSYTATAPVLAKSLTASTDVLTGVKAGTVYGTNARYSTTVDVPQVIEIPFSLSVPSGFNFGQLTVAQVIQGGSWAGTALDAAGQPDTQGINAKIPSDASSTLTAQIVTPFALGTGYDPTQTSISFDYADKNIILKNDGTAATLFSNLSTAPASTLTNLKLNMGPYPQVKAGAAYSATIQWTLTVGPKV